MRPVKYHRLAESELVESALCYESRRAFLGENFLDLVDAAPGRNPEQPGLGQTGKVQHPKLEGAAVSVPHRLSRTGRMPLDSRSGSLEPKTKLLVEKTGVAAQ